MPDEPRETTASETHRETQATISAWARATFPGGDDLSPRHCLRLLEEVAELCMAAGARGDDVYVVSSVAADRVAKATGQRYLEGRPEPAKVPEELADCAIVLAVLAERRGVDLQAEVDRKMAINRARRWKVNDDGTGYHVKADASPASA